MDDIRATDYISKLKNTTRNVGYSLNMMNTEWRTERKMLIK